MPSQHVPKLGASSEDDGALAREYGRQEGSEAEMYAPMRSTDSIFTPELMHLLDTAQRVIDQHVNAYGICADCGAIWPCQRAQLAELALTAL